MGDTVENVMVKYGIGREDQDQFAYHSQMKAKKAMESGRLTKEIFALLRIPTLKRCCLCNS